jgi:hypothetical protein
MNNDEDDTDIIMEGVDFDDRMDEGNEDYTEDDDSMDEDYTEDDDSMDEDYTVYNLPNSINIKGIEFILTKYSGRVEDYDINRKDNEIVYPLRLEKYKPIEINEKNNRPIDIEVAIFFLQNVINKINNKNNSDIIKTVIREDIIHINLNKGTVNTHTYGISAQMDKIENFKTIFIPICISLDSSIGHFNVLVINSDIKTISLYEPLGIFGIGRNISGEHKEIFIKSLNYIRYKLLKKFKEYKWVTSYIEDYMTQEKSDIYQKEKYKLGDVYCVAWCLYLCLFKIFNMHLKDIPIFILLEESYLKLLFDNEDINIFIRRFVSLINESTDYYESNKRSYTLFYGFDNIVYFKKEV